MKTVAIIQARLGSSRLPHKVLADLGGTPMVMRVIERVRRCGSIGEVIVATTNEPKDTELAQLLEAMGVRVFRGSESNVLERYYLAARWAQADVIVRITADCPFIEPEVSDRVVRALIHSRFDFATNADRRSFPRGLDTEAMWFDTLARLHRIATEPPEREHVTWAAYRTRPHLFVTRQVVDDVDRSQVSLTVDTPGDLEAARRIYRNGWDTLGYRDLVERLRDRAAFA